MCSNNNSNSSRSRSRTRRRRKVSAKPSRKTRTKTRKPKYLSLLHLEESLPQMTLSSNDDETNQQQQQQQLNLFPLHPENLVEDKEGQYDNVCLLFNTVEEDNVNAVSLSGILDEGSSDNYKNETTTATTTTSEESPLSPSLTYGYSGEDHTRLLVRSAMKGENKERDASEEKWVVYSEVVEKKEMEEVSSCGGGDGGGGGAWGDGSSSSKKKMKKLLALKLDYEEIMNAWSDKGPLYIEGGESPQTVPHLHHAPNVVGDGWGCASNVWMVPELASNNDGSLKFLEEFDGKDEEWRRGHREASVLRYKEKRQNRLFSKRIRYEVRKLNAEKRPRLKGRFVKRD